MDLSVSSVFETFRGKKCVVIDNFKLTESNVLSDGNVRFRCCNKKCSASVLLDSTFQFIIEWSKSYHNHEAYTPEELLSQKMKVSVKRKAVDSIKEKPTSIIRRKLTENSEENEHSVLNHEIVLFRRAIYRARKKEQPAKSPRNLEEARDQLFDLQGTYLTCKEQFCHVNTDKTMIIFTCSKNLMLLCNAPRVFGDGTFSYAPKYFQQMYTIHVHQNNFYVPVAFCFLSNKCTKTYILMWTELQRICMKLTGKQFNVSTFHSDFENSAHAAVLTVFPGCEIVCCRFHLSQSWFRHIQSDKILLREYNTSDSASGKWLKYFFGLSLLPPSEVLDGFLELIEIQPEGNQFEEFSSYVRDNYVLLARYPPELWASSPSTDPRTTNGAESFHSNYNAEFYHPHPCIHTVVRVLLEIQAESFSKIASINRKVVNAVKSSTAARLNKTISAWNAYCSGTQTRLEYLKTVGYLYQGKKL